MEVTSMKLTCPDFNIGGTIIERRENYFSVDWKLKNIYSWPKINPCPPQFNKSPPFQFANATWYLSLIRMYKNESICMVLNKALYDDSYHRVTFILGIKTKDGNFYKWYLNTHNFADGHYTHAVVFLNISDLRESENALASDGEIIFSCTILSITWCREDIMPTHLDLNLSCQEVKVLGQLKDLSQDMKELFLKEESADVAIKVGDKKFRAHSQILAARSSVFAAMFKHDTEENIGIVHAVDCNPEVFKMFLLYLYTGRVNLSSEYVIDLYSAAKKYNVMELKTLCSDFMKEKMSVDTFGDVIRLAERYSDTQLLDFTTKFFLKNVMEISATTSWMSFHKEYPVQANELFRKAVNHLETA